VTDRLERNLRLIPVHQASVYGLFWLPVVWIQRRLRDIARDAHRDGRLPPNYHRLYRIWFACGFPALFAVLAILWLMIVRPDLGV